MSKFDQLIDSGRRRWFERQERVSLVRKTDDLIDLLLSDYLEVREDIVAKTSALPLEVIRDYLEQDPQLGLLAQQLRHDSRRLARSSDNPRRNYRRETRLEFIQRGYHHNGADDSRWWRFELLFGLSTINALKDVVFEPQHQSAIIQLYHRICDQVQTGLPARDKLYIHWQYPFTQLRSPSPVFRVRPEPSRQPEEA